MQATNSTNSTNSTDEMHRGIAACKGLKPLTPAVQWALYTGDPTSIHDWTSNLHSSTGKVRNVVLPPGTSYLLDFWNKGGIYITLADCRGSGLECKSSKMYQCAINELQGSEVVAIQTCNVATGVVQRWTKDDEPCPPDRFPEFFSLMEDATSTPIPPSMRDLLKAKTLRVQLMGPSSSGGDALLIEQAWMFVLEEKLDKPSPIDDAFDMYASFPLVGDIQSQSATRLLTNCDTYAALNMAVASLPRAHVDDALREAARFAIDNRQASKCQRLSVALAAHRAALSLEADEGLSCDPNSEKQSSKAIKRRRKKMIARYNQLFVKMAMRMAVREWASRTDVTQSDDLHCDDLHCDDLQCVAAPPLLPANDDGCCICLSMPKTHIMVPCGHKCVCGGCAGLVQNVCPICRENVEQVIRVFE